MKILVFFLFTISLNSLAVDTCSLEYLGLQNISHSEQIARVKKVSRLEKIVTKLRSLKANAHLVEIDRKYMAELIKLDQQILEGNTYVAQKQFATFFREFEQSYFEFQYAQKFLAKLRLETSGDFESYIQKIVRTYDKDKFASEVFRDWVHSFQTKSAFKNFLNKKLKKEAKNLGNNYHRYRLINEYINRNLESSHCKAACRGKLRQLRLDIGVGSVNEQRLFPMFSGMKSPKLSEVKKLIYSIPYAYETSLLKEGLYELKEAIVDLLTMTNTRSSLSSSFYRTLNRLFPNHKFTVRIVDQLLAEVESVKNHYPMIERILKSNKKTGEKFYRLTNQNSLFPNDEMLVTFARRSDEAAVSSWDELYSFAEVNNKKFADRMKLAQNIAVKKGELTTDYKKGPVRSYVFILAAFFGYQALNLSFYVDEDNTGELDAEGEVTEMTEIIELKENASDPNVLDMRIPDNNAYIWLLDTSSELLETHKQDK